MPDRPPSQAPLSVSATVWPRQPDDDGSRRRKERRREKRTAMGSTLVAWIVALALALWDLYALALVAVSVSILVLLLAFAWPAAYRKVQIGLGRLAAAVGTAVAWLVLPPFFYLFFGTGRLLRALKGNDRLARRLDSGQDSYWIRRPSIDDPQRYFKRQF